MLSNELEMFLKDVSGKKAWKILSWLKWEQGINKSQLLLTSKDAGFHLRIYFDFLRGGECHLSEILYWKLNAVMKFTASL